MSDKYASDAGDVEVVGWSWEASGATNVTFDKKTANEISAHKAVEPLGRISDFEAARAADKAEIKRLDQLSDFLSGELNEQVLKYKELRAEIERLDDLHNAQRNVLMAVIEERDQLCAKLAEVRKDGRVKVISVARKAIAELKAMSHEELFNFAISVQQHEPHCNLLHPLSECKCDCKLSKEQGEE